MVPGCPVETVPETSEAETASWRRSFWADLPRAFVYPLTTKGIGLLVGAGLVFALLSPGRIHPLSILGLFLTVIFIAAYGYLSAALLKIIQSSAGGDREMPDWPDLTDILDDVVKPFLRVAAAFLAAFAPLLIHYWLRGHDTMMRGWLSWLLMAGGTVYLPMALLAVAVYQSAAAVSPHVVVPAIRRVAAPTIAVAGLLWVSLAGFRLVETPIVGWQARAETPFMIYLVAVVLNVMRFYFIAVVGRLIGIIHWHYGRQLGWLRRL